MLTEKSAVVWFFADCDTDVVFTFLTGFEPCVCPTMVSTLLIPTKSAFMVYQPPVSWKKGGA
jgi:hypothetical protein